MIDALAMLIAASAADQPPVRTIFRVPASEHLIEGITTDRRTIWVTSVLDRHVIAWHNNRFQIMVMPKSAAAPFAIAYDVSRRWLWVATNCLDNPKTEKCGTPSLIAINRSGRLKRQLMPEQEFHPGDVSVDNGRVFVSDTANGAVYQCNGVCRSLEPVILPSGRASAQGSVVYDRGKRLLVADYSRGLVSVDLATKVETPVLTSDGKKLRGIDGLVKVGDRFVGVANAETPGTLVEFEVGADGQLKDLSELATNGVVVDPTQIVVRGNELLAIGDSQWARYASGGAGAQGQQATPVVAISFHNMLGSPRETK